MCWNKSVSLNTFLLGLFGTSLGLLNHIITPLEWLYYMSFISMQLVEYYTWRSLNNPDKIRILSILGMTLILIQPIIKIIAEKELTKKRYYLAAYMIFAVYTAWFISKHRSFTMSKAENGHLAWHWLNIPGWMIAVWLSFVLLPLMYTKEYARAFIITLIVGLIYYTYAKTGTWGSLWCWIANALALIIIYRVFMKDVCVLSK